MSFTSTSSTFPLQNPSKSERDAYDNPVYSPMLSEYITDVSPSKLKMQEEWIVRRKRIFYFLAVSTVIAVVLSTISVIFFKFPQTNEQDGELDVTYESSIVVKEASIITIAQDDNTKDIKTRKSDAYEDYILNDAPLSAPIASLPTLEESPKVAKKSNQKSSHFTSIRKEPLPTDDTYYVYCIISALPSYEKYPKDCNAITFKEIEVMDPTQYLAEDKLNTSAITNIRITSPLSETFVKKILDIFPNIRSITVSIDQLCFGAEVTEKEEWPRINLPNIERLEIENATICLMTNWLLTKWDMPKIETISIHHAKLPKSTFHNLKEFISRHQETLQRVEFVGCSFAKDCSTESLPMYGHVIILEKDTQNNKRT